MATLQSLTVAVYTLPTSNRRCSVNQRLDPQLSFELEIKDSIQTLSEVDISAGRRNIQGPLYVPEFPRGHRCFEETESLIPSNVTRWSDIPSTRCRLVAVAPWVSPDCTLELMKSMRSHDTEAAFFYIPTNSTDTPPVAEDGVWNLTDGGGWKSDNDFPVYAIPGQYGQGIIQSLADFSGKLSDSPGGDKLSESYGPDSEVRVFGVMGFENAADQFPRLWVFIIILLGVFVSIILMATLATRILQRRRRLSLQRGIESGEVDLEMIGIKNLRASQHVLDKMSLYTYGKYKHCTDTSSSTPIRDGPVDSLQEKEDEATQPQNHPSPITTPSSNLPSTLSTEPTGCGRPALAYSQSTCPICLEDYISGESTVRELPCRHIYHPECIDNFLLKNSSLCPVCKETVLPPGFCPEVITDNMIRASRRIRGERDAGTEDARPYVLFPSPSPIPLRRSERYMSAINAHNASLRRLEQRMSPHSMSRRAAPGQPPGPTDSHVNQTDPAERQEVMRRRAMAMLEDQQTTEDEASIPAWRNFLGRIFPTLR